MRRDDGFEVLLLEEEIAAHLAAGEHGWIGLVGPPGSGLTAALRHLAAVFPGDLRLSLLDGPPQAITSEPATVAVYAADARIAGHEGVVYVLVPWESDDCMEYLLARAPDRCGSVLKRLARVETAAPLFARPWTSVPLLDALAADETLEDPADAVHRVAASHGRREPSGPFADRVADGYLRTACRVEGAAHRKFASARVALERRIPILRHATARTLLAARVLARVMGRGRLPNRANPPGIDDLLASVVERLKGEFGGFACIEARLERASAPWQPFLASLLLALDESWCPDAVRLADLRRARLAGARWPGAPLDDASLDRADFRDADLSAASLDRATAEGASFEGARLAEASLRRVRAARASFARADLTDACLREASLAASDFSDACAERADLSDASLVGANLRCARLAGADLSRGRLDHASVDEADLRSVRAEQASLRGVDFRHANLDGADFTRTSLAGAQFDELLWPGALLTGADLQGASLTGARMPGAQLEGASLVGAKLADVDLAGANLQHANFRAATFRMGTSRSGLISSPIASEGSRTGFYSDDTLEMSTLDPDAVRAADLRGADLRGAQLLGADFFLVDLRGARLDPDAVPRLRAMRAILDRPDPA